MTTEDLKTKAVDWLAGQSFNNVLLMCILVSGGWAIHFAVTKAIPDHIREIQRGYETLENRHMQERETIRIEFDRWLERIIEKQIGAIDGRRGRGVRTNSEVT